jgi:hypothetical protein
MINLHVTELEKIPQEAYDALMRSAEEYDIIFEDIDDVQEYIREGAWSEEKIDSCYIYNNYPMEIEGYLFECVGSQYIKDQCICDEQMEEGIYITDLKAKAEADKKAKEEKANKAKTEAFKKWDSFFEEINSELGLDNETTEKLKGIMSQYKFPTKLK